MKKSIKHVLSFVLLIAVAVILISCGKEYTVTIDMQDGSEVTTQKVKEQELAKKPNDPTRDGYAFEGWFKEAEGTNPFSFETKIVADITVYASWREEDITPPSKETFKVTFDSQGGTNIDTQVIDKNGKTVKPTNPTKDNHEFIGWYLDENGTQSFDFNTAITTNVTLYAKWQATSNTNLTHQEVFNAITLPTETKVNLTLPSTYREAVLTWRSSNENIITKNGFITRGSDDQAVTLTLVVDIDGVKEEKTYPVLVLKKTTAPVSEYTPIREVRELSKGASVTIHGVITSNMSNGNYTIEDSTGALAIYAKNNTMFTIGHEYVVKGTLSEFNGLKQIENPSIVSSKGATTLPEVLDLTGYSLEFDDVIAFEGYVVNYFDLTVTEIKTPNNAHEIYFKNEANEASMVRLDKRVNSDNALLSIKVGEIINLFNVSVGQYQGKAQFMFTSRSEVEARPADPDKPQINGAKDITFVIGVDSPNIDYLDGVTAKSASGKDYTKELSVYYGDVNLTTAGNYKVTISLNHVTYGEITQEITVFVRNESKPGEYEGYYQALSGLTGNALNSALQSLIKNTGRATGTTNQVMQADYYKGTYYLIYTGNGPYGNREHVWPNSKLGSAPEYDLHNLRAANTNVNRSRSNYPFGEGSGVYKLSNGTWYPGDEHIGDVARIVLYIHVRYGLNIDLVGNLQMFLRWHEQDPVNDFELSRNDKIQSIQSNRNPFIDHPELVELYFGPAKSKRAAFDISTTLIMIKEITTQVNYSEIKRVQAHIQ